MPTKEAIIALIREHVSGFEAQAKLVCAIKEYGKECTILGINQMTMAWLQANAKDSAHLPPRQWGAPL